MLGSVCRTIRAVLEKSGITPDQIAAVGVDAQMAGILGVGGDGVAGYARTTPGWIPAARLMSAP